MVWRLLLVSVLRFHVRQPWQLGLALAGISLGVAVFVGIQLANRSAERAFELSSSALRGAETHRLLPLGDGLPESVYEDLVLAGFGPNAAPIITLSVSVLSDETDSADGNAATGRQSGRIGSNAQIASANTRADGRRFGAAAPQRARYDMLGIDPVKELRLRRFMPDSDDPAAGMVDLMTRPGGILIPSSLRAALDLGTGDHVTLSAHGETQEFVVLGEIRTVSPDNDAEPPIVADLSSVQRLSGGGILSRIDLSLTGDQARDLARATPAGTALVEAGNQNSELEDMTRAFTTNLSALGLLALVVGMFLIHATMSFSVLRRQSKIATLRALGLSRREVLGSVLLEAVAIGAVAGLAGAVLGQFLANGLIGLVLRTMNDLAFSRSVASAGNPLPIVLLGIALGIGSTVIAAAVPAREAARLAPATAERRSDIEHRARRRSRQLTRLALPTLLLAAVLLVVWPYSLVLGFSALFLVLIAGAMCIPATTAVLMRVIEPAARWLAGLPGTLAVRSVTASLSRTGLATAALAVAVATVMSIGLMVGSFRASLIGWLDTTLTADMYVQIGAGAASDAAIDEWVAAVERLPEVRGTSLTQRAMLPAPEGEIAVRASSPGPEGWGLDLLDGSGPTWEAELAGADAIVVTEPFAYRRGLEAGATLTLPTETGPVDFPIVGVARDYNAAGSNAIMSLTTYRKHWPDRHITGVGVHLREGSDPADVGRRIEAMAPPSLQLGIRSTRAIQQISLLLFDRTFEVTSVLRGLAGIIAFFGVLSAILALQLERRREFQVLRSIGMSLGQLRGHVVVQTALLGLAAGIAAIPIGGVLAWMLVFVINRRSFGWTMSFLPTFPPIGYGLAVALGAALLAGMAAALIGMRSDRGVMAHDE